MKAPPALVKPSGGHAGSLPVQFSATSHGPATGRHTTLEDANPSGGHAAPEPVQFSATSQAPDTGRHSTVAGWNASAGHTVLVPVQFSSTSQEPAAGRQNATASAAECWEGSQRPSRSSTLQGLTSLVHFMPAGAMPSAGQLVLVPVHVSVWSHSPAVGRQTAPAFPAGCWQASLDPSHSSVL